MPPTFAIAGKLTREYLLPPLGNPRLDSPGGSLLYAAGGLAVWDSSLALVSRVNRDYPKEWLQDLKDQGFDISGIQIYLENSAGEMRSFIAYSDASERSMINPVSHFARRGLTFPKSLLGYQPPANEINDLRTVDPLSPAARSLPTACRSVRYIHLCPFDFTSQGQMVSLFKGAGANQIVTLDPAVGYMRPKFWRELRVALGGVTAFLPSEEEIRGLFWGESNDLWEMAQRISDHGPQIVVIKRGASGQMLYDASAKRRYEIPAYPARLFDPTGAGDAFCGGFLAGLQRTNDPVFAVLHGNVSASLKIEGTGPFSPLDVFPGLPEARLYALREMAREV